MSLDPMANGAIICVALATICLALSVNGHGPKVNKYMNSDELKGAIHRNKHAQATKFQRDTSGDASKWAMMDRLDPQTEDVISMLRVFYRGNEAVVARELRSLMEEVPDGEKYMKGILDGLEGNDKQQEDSTGCNACLLVVTGLKALSQVVEFGPIRDAFYVMCSVIGTRNFPNLNVEVFCGGILDLQGPMVYEMLKSLTITPRRQCEFYNSCFPPKASTRVFGLPDNQPQRLPPRKQQPTRDYEDTIKILQLTDVHIEPDYVEGTETACGLPVCCVADWGPGEAGPYGDYQCNIPVKTLNYFLDKAKTMNPDYMIYSGDNPPHSIWTETPESQYNCSRIVAQAIGQRVPGVLAFPNLGNHEFYPTNIYNMDMPETRDGLEMIIEEWSTLANFSQDNVDSMRSSGYYQKLVIPGLRLLSYNTNYMYLFNWYIVEIDAVVDVPVGRNYIRDMERFMQNTLENARTAGEKVMIVGHHPPGARDTIVKMTRWLTDLLVQYKDIIVLHVSGHTHYDEIKMITDPVSGDPVGVVNVAPSLSTGGFRNPSMRMFYLDKSTFKLLDYDHFYIDIEQIIDDVDPEIKLQYRATEEYELADLSPLSWWQLITRMKTDHAMFMKYNMNYWTRGPRSYSCSSSCMVNRLCRAAHSNFDEYLQCTSDNAVTTPVPPPTTTTTVDLTAGAEKCTTGVIGLIALMTTAIVFSI